MDGHHFEKKNNYFFLFWYIFFCCDKHSVILYWFREGDARSPKVRRASTNTLYYRRRGPVSKPVPGLSRSRRLVTFEALSSGECCHAVTMQYRAAPSYTAHEFVVSWPVYFQQRHWDRFSCRRRGGLYRIETNNTDKLSRVIKGCDMTIPR